MSNDLSALEKRVLSRIFYALMGMVFIILTGTGFILYIHFSPDSKSELEELAELQPPAPAVVDGYDVESGLVAKGDYLMVKQNCTSCHSGKLISQNRMTRTSWLTSIRWMQETQNLADLGDNEEPILDYLEKYYSPEKKGRRPQLQDIEWYELY